MVGLGQRSELAGGIKVDMKTGPAEIIKVKLSDDLAGFYKITGYAWKPRPELPTGHPHSPLLGLFGQISYVAISCDSAEVEVAVNHNLTVEVLDQLVELGLIEIVVDKKGKQGRGE